MIDIPMNKRLRDFDSEVDEAVRAVLADLTSPNRHAGALSVNHGCGYWCYAKNGVAYALEVTTHPTERDI